MKERRTKYRSNGRAMLALMGAIIRCQLAKIFGNCVKIPIFLAFSWLYVIGRIFLIFTTEQTPPITRQGSLIFILKETMNMADGISRNVKMDEEVTEELTGLKAIQREAREATKALRELEAV